jgi:hypothetical protein
MGLIAAWANYGAAEQAPRITGTLHLRERRRGPGCRAGGGVRVGVLQLRQAGLRRPLAGEMSSRKLRVGLERIACDFLVCKMTLFGGGQLRTRTCQRCEQ